MAVLLALLLARVAREEAGSLELGAQAEIEIAQRAGDAVSQCTGLAGRAAAADRGGDVVAGGRVHDVEAKVAGGGLAAQADSVRFGIARALRYIDNERRVPLKRAGLLTRDARKKERKKYGQPGARKRFQYSKR